MKTNILFVCLGNICRSPAADGIMHHIVEERGLSGRIGIDSAGTYAGHTGELPDARMRRAASRPAASGTGCAASTISIRRQGTPWP